jgi:hypothetical protein
LAGGREVSLRKLEVAHHAKARREDDRSLEIELRILECRDGRLDGGFSSPAMPRVSLAR